ncbi:SWIM zinc finger family protein [Streptomyces sp. NPDC054796]
MTGTGASGDDERTFDALPPAQGRGFARTWWGLRWLKALEDTALDNQQLKRGRGYARQGAVGAVSVRPGRITAVVRDRDGTPHRADVLLQELSEAQWDMLLEVVTGEAGHIAALLDRDMPPHLVEDAADAGVDLLPGIGDLEPQCACEAWDHCLHTSALAYQMARLLDQDPFVLLLLRGRGERALLEQLQERSAARAAGAPRAAHTSHAPHDALRDGPDDGEGGLGGVPADETFALGAILPPLPEPPPHVPEAGSPPALDGGTPPAAGLDVAALEFLASDAAERARRMLAEALSPGHAESVPAGPLTEWQDAVRLAAARPAPWIAARLAGGRGHAGSGRTGSGRTGSGRAVRQLEPAVRAWEYGGAAALDVLEESWAPEPGALARARDQLESAWADDDGARPRLRATRNHWTVVGRGAQLRYGRDGRWWPYRREDGAWWPAGGAERDPAAALAVLLAHGNGNGVEDSAKGSGEGR